jgi:hypothetical protein
VWKGGWGAIPLPYKIRVGGSHRPLVLIDYSRGAPLFGSSCAAAAAAAAPRVALFLNSSTGTSLSSARSTAAASSRNMAGSRPSGQDGPRRGVLLWFWLQVIDKTCCHLLVTILESAPKNSEDYIASLSSLFKYNGTAQRRLWPSVAAAGSVSMFHQLTSSVKRWHMWMASFIPSCVRSKANNVYSAVVIS